MLIIQLSMTIAAMSMTAIIFLQERRNSQIRKRLDLIEMHYPAPKCPYQNSFQNATDQPCLKRCPAHNGICFRWELCFLGVLANKKEIEEKEERYKQANEQEKL